MTLFFVCVYDKHYPFGGFEDVSGIYDNVDEALEKCAEYKNVDNVEIWKVSSNLVETCVYSKGVD